MTIHPLVLKILLLPLLLVVVAGCSSFGGGRDDDEDAAKVSDRLVIPPDLSQERLGQVPETTGRRSATLSDFASGGSRDSAPLPEPPALSQLETADDGSVSLVIREAYLHGWRRTGLALDRAGFTVEERDRSTGRYVLRYDPGAEADRSGSSLFSRLAFWREREPEFEPGNYVIRVRSDAGNTRLTVEDEEGNAVSPALTERLLGLVDEQVR